MGRRKKQEAVIDVLEFDEKGRGLGYHTDSRCELHPVAVRGAVPGDTVRVVLSRRIKKVYNASVLEYIISSPDKTPQRCKHAHECGGCSMQHVPYDMQLRHKESLVRKLFAPYSSTATFHPILASSDPWRYRNRMDFSFSQNASGERFVGLMMSGAKGRVVDIEDCHLAPPWFSRALAAVRSWWATTGLEAYYPPKDSGTLREIMFREGVRTGDRMAVLTVSGNADYAITRAEIDSFVEIMRSSCEEVEHSLSVFVRVQQLVVGKPTQFYEMHLYGSEYLHEILNVGEKNEITIAVSPAAFFQPNTLQAEKLYALALSRADITRKDTVYDLYCGTGTIGLCAAGRAEKVISIELSPEAVLDARENIKNNGINTMEVFQGDVGKVLDGMLDADADVVILDPPRAGLDSTAVDHVLRLFPKKIVYISCNPKTQAVDVASFVAAGYVLTDIQPVDQFSHTAHLENIAVLVAP